MFQWGIRLTAEFETQMVSVERVLEYGRLDSEPNLETKPSKAIEGGNVKKAWPLIGSVEYRHAGLIYPSAPQPVLSDINFKIDGGQKIGVVGRTGAGKSSLITILFRLAEPEGCILIDGVDTKNIGLHELRRNISIIPQDPGNSPITYSDRAFNARFIFQFSLAARLEET